MNIFPLSVIAIILAVVTVSAQKQPLMVFWDEAPTCGRSSVSLEPGSIICALTQDKVSSQLRTFLHGDVSVSMTYWRFSEAVRVLVVVENRGQTPVPVNVKMWNLTAFKTFESFEGHERPLFMSRPEKPLAVISKSELDAVIRSSGSSGLPTNDPLTTQTTERRVYNPDTGRSTTEKNTKIVPETTVPPSSISLNGKTGDSALKWTEIKGNTKSIGEVSFGTRTSATFHLLSLDVNGVVYIYPLKPRAK